MIDTIPDILARIVAVKREELMSLPDPGRRLVDRATRDVDPVGAENERGGSERKGDGARARRGVLPGE